MADFAARVYVVGVGMTKFEKPGTRKDFDYPEMVVEAVSKALKDANLEYLEIQQACVGYVYGDSTCGQRALYELGMTGIPVFNINNNCSTGATAIYLAKQIVESGNADCVLALGFEKMERGSLSSKFEDRTNPLDKHVGTMYELAKLEAAPIAAQLFGNAGKEHMEKYGTKLVHFAKIAYKNHNNSIKNPYSQFRQAFSLEQIMNSPRVFGPLTKLQCCPTSDGAAAAILASEDFVTKHKLQDQAVLIAGMEMCTDLSSTFTSKSCISLVGYDMTKNATNELFGKSPFNITDVNVIELHDCFSTNELITYEALGLCPPGKAGEFIDRGDNTYGGRYVINPSGGLISKGHPLGATGVAQCVELCWQLRGEAGERQVENARVALQHNIGLGGAAIVALYTLGFSELQACGNTLELQWSINEPSKFKSAVPMKLLAKAMSNDKTRIIEKFRGVYVFRVKNAAGQVGMWVVNAKFGKGKIEFNSSIKPDVVFIMKDEDVGDLIFGKMNVQKGFFQGRIKMLGSFGMALKLIEFTKLTPGMIEKLRAKL